MNKNELFFIPLGGVGEIGMNLAVYGYGTPENKEYLIVDMGVSFADEEYPGADLVMPDISFLEEEAINIVGMVITHGHEDHYGAVAELWSKLQVPIYCTAFTSHLLRSKFAIDYDFEALPLHVFTPGDNFSLGNFAVDTIRVNHSIPEAVALSLKTPIGTIVHTGDWKIDDKPALNDFTDIEKFKQIGDEGVLALICDSTNAMVESTDDTEFDVQETLSQIIAKSNSRVAITSFSSNIGRIKSIIAAAKANDRKILLLGRSIKRSVGIAIELGYIEDENIFITEPEFASVPRNKIVVILTGSQGEPRAALAKIASKEMKTIEFVKGDIIVYSSRMIPGNEKKVLQVQNALVKQGIKIITNFDAKVHVSGHAKRGELREMYSWVKPQILVPVHGQPMHLEAQAELGYECNIKQIAKLSDGEVLRLAPDKAEVVDRVLVGKIFKDGKLVGEEVELGIATRRRLSQVGHITISILFTKHLSLIGAPRLVLCGVPSYDKDGYYISDLINEAIEDYLYELPIKSKKDKETVQKGSIRAVQRLFDDIWGKRPIISVITHYLKY